MLKLVATYIDALIPGLIGLLLVIAPGLFTRPTGGPTIDGPRRSKLARSGYILLVIAGAYFLMKVSS